MHKNQPNTNGSTPTKYSVRVVNGKLLKDGESFLDSTFNTTVQASSKKEARHLVSETYQRPDYYIGSAWKK